MAIQHPVLKQISALLDQVEEPILKLFESGNDAEAIQQAKRLKDYAVRYKAAAGDVFDTFGQQIAEAAREASQQPGADGQAVQAQLQQFLKTLQAAGQQIRTGTRLSDDEKAATTKGAHSFTPIQQAVIGNFPGLYGLEPKKGPTKR